MKQPTRQKKKVVDEIKGTGEGLNYCNECPFFIFKDGEIPYCNVNDIVMPIGSVGYVTVPDWCGNKKK